MTQVPQISRKNDDRLDHLAGLSVKWTASYKSRQRLEKVMIILLGKMASQKILGHLDHLRCLGGFEGLYGIPHVAKERGHVSQDGILGEDK